MRFLSGVHELSGLYQESMNYQVFIIRVHELLGFYQESMSISYQVFINSP
jgi:hypothetical protein